MNHKLEKQIANFINTESLIPPGQKILLAISGGADSVAMLYALNALKDSLQFHIAICHINHCLRGPQSDADQQFVIDLANKLNLPCKTKKVDVSAHAKSNKQSIETAARNLRLQFLTETAANLNCQSIATAHHKDDNAETLIHRLTRGTSYPGLAGIRPTKTFDSNTTIIRPLLCATRKQIIAYLNDNNITHRHDHTNDQTIYTRNKIRHKLLPYLQSKCRSNITDQLANLANNARKLQTKIETQANTIYPKLELSKTQNSVTLDAKTFAESPDPIKTEITKIALAKINTGLQNFTQSHYKNILTLPTAQNKTIELPDKTTAAIQYNKLTFARKTNAPDLTDTQLNIPGQTNFANFSITTTLLNAEDCNIKKFIAEKDNHTEWFDYDKIAGQITTRRRKPGDTFHPLGAPGPKKIGNFLTDQKIPNQTRDQLIVLNDTEKIIYLAPIRTCNKTKISKKTKTILQIKLQRDTIS